MKNEEFVCKNCGKKIIKHPEGSARNHCNHCLYSLHLDKVFPGDRKSECQSLMKPIAKEYKKNKGRMVIQKCITCGHIHINKLAPDDNLEVYAKIK